MSTMDLGLACLAGAEPPGTVPMIAAAGAAAILAVGASKIGNPFVGVPVFIAAEESPAAKWAPSVIHRFAMGHDQDLAVDRGCPLFREQMFGATPEERHVVADMLIDRGDAYGEALALHLARKPWILVEEEEGDYAPLEEDDVVLVDPPLATEISCCNPNAAQRRADPQQLLEACNVEGSGRPGFAPIWFSGPERRSASRAKRDFRPTRMYLLVKGRPAVSPAVGVTKLPPPVTPG